MSAGPWARPARAWLPLAAYALAIFAFSSLSRIAPPPLQWHVSDKLVHFAEYAGLGLLAARAIRLGAPDAGELRVLAAAWLLVVAIGAADELYQSYVPFRRADLAADALGGALGMALTAGIRAMKKPA